MTHGWGRTACYFMSRFLCLFESLSLPHKCRSDFSEETSLLEPVPHQPPSPALRLVTHICTRWSGGIFTPGLNWRVSTDVFTYLGRPFSFFSLILSLFMIFMIVYSYT